MATNAVADAGATTRKLVEILGEHAERDGSPVADATDLYSSYGRYIIRSPLAPGSVARKLTLSSLGN